jgi:cytochrome d ubiquinol oxidase subunit I
VRLGLRTGVTLAAVLIPVQILVGDMHGLNTLEHQPAKVAAMEGNWETHGNVPLVLFGLPNAETRQNDYAIEVPSGASFILTHRLDGVVPGIDQFGEEHPPVAPVFFAFRVMVGVGVLMLAVSWATLWLLRRRGEVSRWNLRVLAVMTPAGWVATLAGWYVTEIGRQPWVVNGVLSTADAAGPVAAPLIAGSLAAYLAVYAGLLAAYVGVVLYLARKAGERDGEPKDASPVTAFMPAE